MKVLIHKRKKKGTKKMKPFLLQKKVSFSLFEKSSSIRRERENKQIMKK